MDIKFIAFESLGVRSQATFVQTKDANIFIDPSAALAPRRFGFPPHILEVEKLLDIYSRIENLLRDSDILIFTHYHYDHHDPGKFLDPELYRDKIVFLKDPHNNINISQRVRASRFLKILRGKAKDIRIADGGKEILSKTVVKFSNPLPHGESYRLGYVIGACIDEGEDVLMYTSDIEGGPKEAHRELLNFCKARIAVLDGPPTYLVGYRYSIESLRSSIDFLSKLIEVETIEIVIIDHHLCRDLGYVEKLGELIKKAKSMGVQIKTAAEFMGLEPLFLEAMRKELYIRRHENGLKLLKSRYRGVEGIEDIFGDDC